jgi:hypothetical protein
MIISHFQYVPIRVGHVGRMHKTVSLLNGSLHMKASFRDNIVWPNIARVIVILSFKTNEGAGGLAIRYAFCSLNLTDLTLTDDAFRVLKLLTFSMDHQFHKLKTDGEFECKIEDVM